MSVAALDIVDSGSPVSTGGAENLRAVFGDLLRLRAEAAGIQAQARHRVPDDLDERLARLTKGLGRAAGRLSSSCEPRHALPAARPASAIRHRNQGWAALTRAELEVIRVVVAGRTNREAAALLFLSPHTVSSHLRHAYTKLGINSRVELVRVAVALELARFSQGSP